MELAAARQEGFTSKRSTETTETNDAKSKRPLVVIGILTKFGREKNREAIRKAWMGTGIVLLVFVLPCFPFLVDFLFVCLFFSLCNLAYLCCQFTMGRMLHILYHCRREFKTRNLLSLNVSLY